MRTFQDKVFVVTGASSGIGEAMATSNVLQVLAPAMTDRLAEWASQRRR